ncbi:MAG: FadR family transcriptional regulator [Planctomycetaceae bacterium]|nr:MAG: FadR family transcriptional regulator [Planctomycetaceae bacterium]
MNAQALGNSLHVRIFCERTWLVRKVYSMPLVKQMNVIGRPKLRTIVAKRLKTFIVKHNLQSGDRLPTETELAKQFGVSRLSLREATKSFEFLGILESKPGRGLTVGSVNMERVTEYLGFHPALHGISLSELIDTRVLIETGVLAHVSQRMKENNALYDKLSTINESLRQARSLARWIELDSAFHRELICASGLSPLMAFTDVLAVFFKRFRESIQKAEWSQGIQSHQQIIEFLKAGRVVDAKKELRFHIESHSQRVKTPTQYRDRK